MPLGLFTHPVSSAAWRVLVITSVIWSAGPLVSGQDTSQVSGQDTSPVGGQDTSPATPDGGADPQSPFEFEDPTSAAAIRQYIRWLGHDSYLVRREAAAQLENVGLKAFEQLSEAQFDPDIEVETAARYLIGSLLVSWAEETDPKPVKEMLREYGGKSPAQRAARIRRLARLPDAMGMTALARLARYETSSELAYQAALSVMGMPDLRKPETPLRSAEMIRRTIGNSDRVATGWLALFADDLEGQTYSSSAWEEKIRDFRNETETQARLSERSSVLELIRICATRAAVVDGPKAGSELAIRHLDMVSPATTDVIENATWALESELYDVVVQLHERFGSFFTDSPILLYSAAQAYKELGNSELSVQLADRAAKLPPLPLLDGTDNMSPRSREQSRKTHRQIAGSLRGRGLFEWAEREYRLVIQSAPMNDPTAMGCRIEMLEMLGDLERHADAIAIIQPLLDRISRDDETRGRFMQFANYAEDQLRGLYLFHRAETEIAADKLEKARASLTKGFRLFPENIDILIRMYRVDGDQKWKTIVDAKLRTLIAGYEAQLNLQPGAAAILGSSQRRLLAANCNQYAWLVSNTRGDFRRALEAGKLAVKLDPGYANLDTLARCYYALGRYDEALATQRQAIELEPHSPPLQRQLKLIETAREQTKSESAKPEPAKPERSK